MSNDESDAETPHPELTFDTPSFERWVLCPECRSRHVNVQMRELDDDATVWFLSNIVVWFECLSCGYESMPEPGDFVEQPDDLEKFSLRDRLRRWVNDVI